MMHLERLAELWNRNRTKTYYRLGIATEGQAEAVHELATEMRRDLVDGSQSRVSLLTAMAGRSYHLEIEYDGLQPLYRAWRAALPPEKRIEW